MDNEWYTPKRYIAAAREVLGNIELDPASCAAANQIVKAERFYTQEQNGLQQDWTCNTMWLNPPYGKAYGQYGTSRFVKRLLAEYHAGRVQQAILLVLANTEAQWFGPLWAYPICFADHKLHFHTTSPTKKNPTATHIFGTAFVYLGAHEEKFIHTFGRFGNVVKRVSIPQRLYNPELRESSI